MQHALEHVRAAHPSVDVDYLDLATESPEPFRGFEAHYKDETNAIVDRVMHADAYIIGSPVYNGSHSAAVKNLFEFVDYKALEDRVAGFVLVASGAISFLQARTHLDQLMTYFNVRSVPRGVYVKGEDVEDDEIPRRIRKRLEALIAKVLDLREAYPPREREAEA
jgi:FMN reductase